jgi:hypothetical protein
MKWSRSKAKSLSLLALFALALQFCLSFGHCHHELTAAMVSARQSQAYTPDTSHDQYVHRDLCAICSTVAMTSHAVAAAAPSLPLPLAFATHQVAFNFEFIASDSRPSGFRSRAPPQS